MVWSHDRNASFYNIFEASSDGSLFTLNVLDGELLVNGVPPNMLPSSIRNHDEFKRTFSSLDFRVSASNADKLFKTMQSYGGCSYEFRVIDGEDEVGWRCKELWRGGFEFELIPHTAMAKCLPRKIVETNSFWFCRSLGVVLARDKSALTVHKLKDGETLFDSVKYVINIP